MPHGIARNIFHSTAGGGELRCEIVLHGNVWSCGNSSEWHRAPRAYLYSLHTMGYFRLHAIQNSKFKIQNSNAVLVHNKKASQILYIKQISAIFEAPHFSAGLTSRSPVQHFPYRCRAFLGNNNNDNLLAPNPLSMSHSRRLDYCSTNQKAAWVGIRTRGQGILRRLGGPHHRRRRTPYSAKD